MAYGDNLYTVIVDEIGDIYEISGYQKGRKLGVDIRREAQFIQEIQEKNQDIAERDEIMDNWHSILLENGLIKIPKTAEEEARDAANEQIRIVQEQAEQFRLQAEQQAERFNEQAKQQSQINQALLESVQKSNQTIAQFESSIQQSNETISNLENIVKELMKHEPIQNNVGNDVKRIDNNISVRQSPKKPASTVKNNGKVPAASSISDAVGKTNSSTSV